MQLYNLKSKKTWEVLTTVQWNEAISPNFTNFKLISGTDILSIACHIAFR